MARHLDALRTAFAPRPELHRHQLAALEAGASNELARASWLDRLEAEARIAVAVGDPWRARAAVIEHAATIAAGAAWPGAGVQEAAPLRRRSEDGPAAYARLLVALVRRETTADMDDEWPAHVEAARDAAAGVDPDAPGCVHRTPWPSLRGWAVELDEERDELGGDVLADLERARNAWTDGISADPEDQPGPSADDVLAPYRTLVEVLPEGDPTRAAAERALVTAAGAEDGADALALLIEGRSLTDLSAAPWRTRAAEGLAHQAAWPDPLVAHHWNHLVAALDAAATPTEVDFATLHADACFAVERDWNTVFHAVLLAPMRAAYLGHPERAAAVAHGITGLGPRALTATPRAVEFLEAIIATEDDVLALEGEAGFEAVQAARFADTVVAPDFGALEEPAADPKPAVLWGTEIDIRKPIPQPRRPEV